MDQLLDQTYFGNSVWLYITTLGIFLLGLFIVFIFKIVILSKLRTWAEKTDTQLDDLLIEGMEKSLIPLSYFATFYVALQTLELSVKVEKWLHIASVILLTFYLLKAITTVISHATRSYIKREHGAERETQMRGITYLLNLLIWSIGLMFLLDNLGFKISAVIAGLGIGGIAIALAAQTVLGDLFNYFVIFFDRPFEIGDFLIVEDKMGTVEYIGIKTTRIRSLGGELMIFHNTDLTNARIHNYQKMEKRRVVFQIGVIYQTTADQLEEIPRIIKEIIVKQEDATFDRTHFANFGDFSLNFEIVYYVLSADYSRYMDIQQAINLSLFREFEQKGIGFAYPTQTLFVNKVT